MKRERCIKKRIAAALDRARLREEAESRQRDVDESEPQTMYGEFPNFARELASTLRYVAAAMNRPRR
jgi:hypothetical protein